MNNGAVAETLAAAGMTDSAARTKAAMFRLVTAALDERGRGAHAERTAWFVPGRIEVLGKHTDYAGGRSLLAAAERGFAVVAQARDDDRVVVADVGRHSSYTTRLDPDIGRSRGWENYGVTVARRIARNFPRARRGADIVFQSDLPSASGMSSSSAMMIAVFLGIADANGLADAAEARTLYQTREQLAAYLSCVENGQGFGTLTGDGGVGTSGGSEDHTAILCCTAGRLAQYAFCPVRREGIVDLAPELVFAIAASGVSASKTGSAQGQYNDASGAVSRMLALWRERTGRSDATLADALGSEADAPQRIRALIRDANDAPLQRRLEQFIEESDRIVPAAAARLAQRDFAGFGALVDRSQALAESCLGNQVPETIALARFARQSGALAASAFGAGFGGSVWALVRTDDARTFIERWSAAYGRSFPAAARRATFFTTRPGPGATRVMGNGQ